MFAQTLDLGTMVRQDELPTPALGTALSPILPVEYDLTEGKRILGAFRDYLGLRGKSSNTLEAYVGDVAGFVAFIEERYEDVFTLDAFNRTDLQAFYRRQVERKVAPATWNRQRAALRAFAAWLLATDQMSYDPTDGLAAMEEVDLAPRWLVDLEYGRLIQELERCVRSAKTAAARRQALRDRAVVLLMSDAGLREGEVVALNVGDLDLGERKGWITVRMGKGNKTRRVAANLAVRDALKAYLATCPGAENGAPVFIGKKGERLQARGIQRRVEEIGVRAKVAGLTPHRLRHTFAKRLLDAGAKLTEVAKLMGHDRLDTTARYTQPSEGDLAAAVEKI